MPRAASRLRRIVLLAGAPAAALAVAAVAFLANQGTSGEIQRNAAARLQTSATRLSQAVDQYLQERRTDVRALAHSPGIVGAVRAASADAARRGFDQLAANEVTGALADSVALNAPQSISNLLESQIGFTSMTLTEQHGIRLSNTSAAQTDIVSFGEEWWRGAMQDGEFRGTSRQDPATGGWVYDLAVQIFDPEINEPIGVLRGVVSLEPLEHIIASDGAAVSVSLVDSLHRVLLTDDSKSIAALENAGALPLSPTPTVALRRLASSEALVAAVPVTRAPSWWLIAQEPLTLSTGAATSIRNALYAIGGVMLALTLIVFLVLTRWLDLRITRPVRTAGTITRRIADGDLTVELLDHQRSSDEVGDLLTSIGQMVTALRNLVGAIRSSAEDSSAMAGQISASTEQMSAGSQQMAGTCQDLAMKASQHAGLIRKTATDAGRMLEIASKLAEGTNRSASRNMALKQTAEDHRTRLLEGSEQLTELADEIGHAAEEAQSLTEMSAEIQKFVAQAQSIAADTNMLSLNAAIEASRAEGGDGRGFGVVADEVRKLATQTVRAAADTENTVNRILQIVDTTRARLERLAEGSTAVQEVAESAASGLQEVADTAAEHSVWTEEISNAANGAQTLIAEMTSRLTTLADGTESFLNAVEELAVTAQEQTASTEEIAGSAGQLATASERLNENVSSFRLHNGKPREFTLTP